MCPPLEWRTPPNLDGFNAMLRTLAAELGVGLLETADIVGPVWDQGQDWAHPDLAFPIIAERIRERVR